MTEVLTETKTNTTPEYVLPPFTPGEILDHTKTHQVFEFDPTKNQERKEHYTNLYKGVIQLDENALTNLDISQEDKKALLEVLSYKKNRSYEETKASFNGNPLLLLASMSFLVNNYKEIVNKVDFSHTKDLKGQEVHKNRPQFLFNKFEETLFLTGRTLLKTLNREIDNEYINDLIKDTDGIIARFNEGLIGKYVKKYSFLAEAEELFQEGYLGVMEAVKKFKIDKGRRFSTYATYHIKKRMLGFIEENSGLSRDTFWAVQKYKKVRKRLKENYGKEPSFQEVVSECRLRGIKLPKRTDYFKSALLLQEILSLDQGIVKDSSDERTLYDKAKDKNTMIKIERLHNKEFVNFLIEETRLSEKELTVVTAVHELDGYQGEVFDTNKELAQALGLDISDFYDTRKKAYKKLRKVALRITL